ncbi:hypothetical protein OO013_19290 [Mangrovivirga sp. M17]|uniref:Lipocalin-like domain-containing protein n=1 Tax=Mangrovivirga halotolerans TaxID=2993936 RepID=A0ABT3RW72_9BACT|nr:hypothetical protein [Mangrovivirga halotolerans]MCX2746033.1 hypothetical protein [Mangrovivirga halotolerans]
MKTTVNIVFAILVLAMSQSCSKPAPAVEFEGTKWLMTSYSKSCNQDDYLQKTFDCEQENCVEYYFDGTLLIINSYDSLGIPVNYQYEYYKNGNQLHYDTNEVLDDEIGEVYVSYHILGKTLYFDEFVIEGCQIEREFIAIE